MSEHPCPPPGGPMPLNDWAGRRLLNVLLDIAVRDRASSPGPDEGGPAPTPEAENATAGAGTPAAEGEAP